MTTYYLFVDEVAARSAHAAIDDARCGANGYWPDGVTQRHTSLTRDGGDWLIAVTGFTESQRGTRDEPGPLRDVLPEPEEVDFAEREITLLNPNRTDVVEDRRR